jgi:Peptidase family C25
MRPRSIHNPSRRAWLWHGTAVFWIAATLIALGLQGTVTAAPCTNTTFAGNTFTVNEVSTGQGNGTASVSGCDGNLTNVSVTLTFNPNTLPFERDLDLLLVHPNGENNLIFFSGVGNNAAFTGTITLADSGATCPPQETGSGTGALVSGTTYKPVNYPAPDFEDAFGPSAPATQFSAGQGCTGASGTHSFASAFAGLSANGTWTLYAYDDIAEVIPNYTVSWSLTVTTSTTEARVESFTATPVIGEGIQLHWRTGQEVDNLGFNIYREVNGQRTKLNPSPIAGSALLAGPGTALTAGRSYVWWDTSAQLNKGTLYWLEDVDLSGQRTRHGPASVAPPVHPGSSPSPGQAQAVLLSGVGRAAAHSRATAPAVRRATLAQPPTLTSARQSLLAAQPAIKLGVRQEGWYRVRQPELMAAGLDPRVDPRFLHLYVDGWEVPMLVTGEEDGQFDAADGVEFYGLGLDEAWTDARVYWLVPGARPGRRIAAVSGGGDRPSDNGFPFTVERNERTVYFSALRNGERENFFGAVVSPEAVEQSLHVKHLAPSPSGVPVLEVALQGVTSGMHLVRVSLNGIGVGDLSFQDQELGRNSFPIAASWLYEGENVVELVAQGGERDISLVDRVRLTYLHTYTADADALRFSASGGQRVTVGGFSGVAIRVLDVTDADAVWEVTGVVQPQGPGFAITLAVPSEGPRTLFAFTPEQARSAASITANQPSRWRRPGHGADLVIVSRGDFMPHVESLRAQRQSEGLQVAVVAVEDIYDEFSTGHHTPYAVRDFLSYAVKQWHPAPRFVLLVGDASMDPKNYLDYGDHDFIPTKLIDTGIMETASDDWLADFDDDGLPELAVGRLPVRTIDAAKRVLAKILGYNQAAADGGVLLVADLNDGFDFAAMHAALQAWIPPTIPVEAIDRGQIDDAEARNQLLASLNRGPAVVNYTGHGSVDLWRGHLLTADDAAELRNDEQLSLFVTMTCLNGYFHDAALDSLAEALLHADGGGAVAVWAPSGITGPSGQSVMNQELFRWVFSERDSPGAPLRLGEAVVRAKAAVGDDDVRRTWILLGDPSMPLPF